MGMCYSGHTVIVTVFALAVTEYVERTWLTKMMIWIMTFITYVSIITTKYHYTLDVLAAALITVLSWKCYHLYISHPDLSSKNRFLLWLESPLPDSSETYHAPRYQTLTSIDIVPRDRTRDREA